MPDRMVMVIKPVDVNYPPLKRGAFCSPGIFSASIKQNNPGPPGWFTAAPISEIFLAPL